MAILSAAELNEQADLAYVRGTYYVALLNSSTDFGSSIDYATVLANEVTSGLGGYSRVSFTYVSGDLLAYSDGQPLSQKTANFIHDGSSSDIVFTHVVLLREYLSVYTVVAVQSVGDVAILNNGNTAKIKIDVLHGKI